MMIHWGNVASLLVPVTVVIIGHHGYPVKILGNRWNVVGIVNYLLAWRDSCRELMQMLSYIFIYFSLTLQELHSQHYIFILTY